MENLLYQGIVSEVYIGYKTKIKAKDRVKITNSEGSYQIFKTVWDTDTIDYKESFKCLYLDRNGRALAISNISEGGISSTIADEQMIMTTALKLRSSALILSHNHPSGNLEPSNVDKSITKKIACAGELLNINVLDHIIISSEGYFSFADEGLM